MPEPFARRIAACRPACVAAAALLTCAAGAAGAQPYKQVLPDGRVAYSDLPPDAAAVRERGRTPAAARAGGNDSAEPDPGTLPYALRTAALRHPVVLYTTSGCMPCTEARTHLVRRGIPFAERQVLSERDAAAFRQIGFPQTDLPAVSVGTQRASGFAPGQWDQLLELAGYPKGPVLPAGWRLSPARPLADGRRTPEPVEATVPAAPAAASTPPSATSLLGVPAPERTAAPPGFRF